NPVRRLRGGDFQGNSVECGIGDNDRFLLLYGTGRSGEKASPSCMGACIDASLDFCYARAAYIASHCLRACLCLTFTSSSLPCYPCCSVSRLLLASWGDLSS